MHFQSGISEADPNQEDKVCFSGSLPNFLVHTKIVNYKITVYELIIFVFI